MSPSRRKVRSREFEEGRVSAADHHAEHGRERESHGFLGARRRHGHAGLGDDASLGDREGLLLRRLFVAPEIGLIERLQSRCLLFELP